LLYFYVNSQYLIIFCARSFYFLLDSVLYSLRIFVKKIKDTFVSSAEKALTVLVTLAQHPQAMTVKEIAAQLGQPLSSVYRYLAMLQRHGLVQEIGHTYCPGAISLQLAQQYEQHALLAKLALPELKRLAFKIGESVGLMTPVNYQAMCIQMIESQHPLRCYYAKGRSQPLIRGSAAKAMLAYMGERVQREAFDFHATDKDSWEHLQEELENVREQGYAVSEGEIDAGVWGVSAPVFSRQRRLEGSVCIMIPLNRAKERKAQMVNEIVQAATRMSIALTEPF
jgi:DNA-binding IclR family transcriptional regulator